MVKPKITAKNRNLLRQTSQNHCVKYLFESGCMRKKDRRMSTTSQARKSENQVRVAKHVARARKMSSHPLSIESLQLVPMVPSPNP